MTANSVDVESPSIRGGSVGHHIGAVGLGLLVTAGLYKVLIPVIDATVAAALLTVVGVAIALVRRRFHIPTLGLLPMIVFFLVLALAAFWGGTTQYATAKVQAIFTLTSLAAIAPFFVIRDTRQYRTFLTTIVIVGLISGAVLTLQYASSTSPDRLAIGSASPIGLARLLLLAALLLLLGAFSVRRHTLLAIAIASPLIVLAIASGSRGPLISFLLGLIVGSTVVAARTRTFKVPRGRGLLAMLLSAGLLALLVVPWALRSTPEYAASRLSTSLQGGLGVSDIARLRIVSQAIGEIISHPFGLGWGSFQTTWNTEVVYAHNMFLEVTGEAGWIAGLLLLAIVGMSFKRAASNAAGHATWVSATWFGVSAYVIGNAMVSGDINGNRIVLTLISVGLALFAGSNSADSRPQDAEPLQLTRSIAPSTYPNIWDDGKLS